MIFQDDVHSTSGLSGEKTRGGKDFMYTGETKISLWGPYAANLVDFSGLVVFNWFILRGKEYFGFFESN